MAEDIVFTVDIDPGGKGGQSLTTLKAEFKNLQKELAAAEVGTEKYNKTLQKLGAVKDELGDLRNTINALNPEGKVQAFANVAGKLAGGFQAATGAAALFGVQTEELEKQLLRVQAATALAQGIQSVIGLSDAFKVLGAVIASNPILGIVGIVTAAAGAIALMTQNTADLEKAQKTLNKTFEDSEARLNSYAKELFETQLEIDVLNGKITEQQANILKLEKETTNERVKLSKDYAKQIIQLATDLGIDLELIEINKNGRIASVSLEGASDQFNARLKFNQEVLKIQKQANAEAIALQQVHQAEVKVQRLKGETDINKTVIDSVQSRGEGLVTGAIQFQTKELALVNQTEEFKRKEAERTAAIKKGISDKEIADAELAAIRKEAIEQIYYNAASSLSNTYFNLQIQSAQGNAKKQEELRKKQFQVDKAFRAGQAIMDTYKAINATLAIAGPLSAPLAVAIGVAGFANVAKILSQQYQGGGAVASADVNVGGSPQIQTQAPVLGTPNTRLNEAGQNQSTIRAVVVETDITDSQDRVRRLKEQATF